MTSVYALGPGDRHASFLVESVARLKDRGYNVTVVAPSYHGLRSHSIDGTEVVRFRYFPARWENLTHGDGAPNRIGNPFYFAMAAPYVASGLVATLWAFHKRRFAIGHVQWPFPHAIWGIAAKWVYGVPLVFTFHGAEILLAERFAFVRWFLKWALTKADAVTCNSRFTAAKVARLTERPITVLPYGAAVVARPRQRPAGSGPAPFTLLFVGRLIPRKGLRYLIEALAQLDVEAKLLVVGEGPERAICEELAGRLGAVDRIEFLGFVPNEELERIYGTADAFILPSIVDAKGDTEGLGVVLIEAMSFMTPVIASAVGGITDVVRDGETGLLVPEKDPAALAEAIERLLGDSDLCRTLGENGRHRVAEYFDWSRITDGIDEVYRTALDAR